MRQPLRLLLPALLLGGCSLVDEPQPRAELGFSLHVDPAPPCADSSADAPGCRFDVEGVVSRKVTRASEGDRRFPITDVVLDDSLYVLRFVDFAGGELSMEEGQPYRFEGDLRGVGWTSLPALRVTDERGLVFYGLTDMDAYFLPETGTRLLPQDWRITTEPTLYGNSRRDDCGVRFTPQRVRVEHGGKTARLLQGQSARLGTHVVHVRTALDVDGSQNRCVDNGAPSLSLTIRRD